MRGSRDRHPEEERKKTGTFPREAGGRMLLRPAKLRTKECRAGGGSRAGPRRERERAGEAEKDKELS